MNDAPSPLATTLWAIVAALLWLRAGIAIARILKATNDGREQ